MMVERPNITAPTSALMLGCVLTNSATSSARRRVGLALAGRGPVAVELHVREVGAPAFRQPHGLERRRDVAGVAEVVAVDVHRVRQAQGSRRLDEPGDDLAGRELKGPDLVVQ